MVMKPIADSLAESGINFELEAAREAAFNVELLDKPNAHINSTRLVPTIEVLLFTLFPCISSNDVCRYGGGQLVMYRKGDFPQNGHEVIIHQFGNGGDTEFTRDYEYKSGTCYLNVEGFKKVSSEPFFYGEEKRIINIPRGNDVSATYLTCILESIGAEKAVRDSENGEQISYTTTMKQLREVFISECNAVNALVANKRLGRPRT